MKFAYYNEHDPRAAAWIRELMKAGLIMEGEVDERSIEDVQPSDLAGFIRCHFFAGISGWDYALRLAGWPDDRPIWTGSCPCQPFSAAGKGTGFADERHLWPAWFHLIQHGKPRNVPVFGEQVASKDGLAWLDLVHADLEGAGYAVGAFDLCAAGVGAPHIRQRLWFVADPYDQGLEGRIGVRECSAERSIGSSCMAGRLADSDSHEQEGRPGEKSGAREEVWLRDGNDLFNGVRLDEPYAASQTNGLWRDADWLLCRDGKWRPVEPSTSALVAGLSKSMGHGGNPSGEIDENATPEARVMRLRGYGNAINPYVAAEVIRAYMQ